MHVCCTAGVYVVLQVKVDTAIKKYRKQASSEANVRKQINRLLSSGATITKVLLADEGLRAQGYYPEVDNNIKDAGRDCSAGRSK